MGTPVEAYLRTRGFQGSIPATLRFLPDARHPTANGRFPAMIAGVSIWPSRAVTAIHRTYIRADGAGKAALSPDKATLGPIRGGAVRLAPAGQLLAVAEGIETALAVLAATDLGTWAALSAGGLKRLVLPAPPLAAEVVIFADHDQPGRVAAVNAAERWHAEGRRVRIAVPPDPGTDFNDLLSNFSTFSRGKNES